MNQHPFEKLLRRIRGTALAAILSASTSLLVASSDSPADAVVRVSYPAYRFAPTEGWHLRSDGNGGASRRDGSRWLLDFSVGARSHTLSVPDRVLPGNVDRIRIRARGSARGHPVRLVL